MPLGCHLLSEVRGPGEAPVHHFTDRDDGEGGWWLQRAWDRAMPARTLCPHCPPVPTPSTIGPRAPRVQVLGAWISHYIHNLLSFPGERRETQEERLPEIQNDWAVQGGGRNQKLPGRGNPRELFAESSLITPSSPRRDLSL